MWPQFVVVLHELLSDAFGLFQALGPMDVEALLACRIGDSAPQSHFFVADAAGTDAVRPAHRARSDAALRENPSHWSLRPNVDHGRAYIPLGRPYSRKKVITASRAVSAWKSGWT